MSSVEIFIYYLRLTMGASGEAHLKWRLEVILCKSRIGGMYYM